MTDEETIKRVIRDHVIAWNKNQFYRAINQDRFEDARRYKENIERLEEQKPGY